MKFVDKSMVSLVGAGCSKEHLTLGGLEKIKMADVIIYDDLIDSSVLFFAKPECELIYAGKRHKKHSLSQEEINRLLVCKAKQNKNVVRLKGGDSFVFARGGEEILALEEENIDFEVLPGVSSCIAAAERVGIPVTHRGVSQSFTVVTGHTAGEKNENYKALASLDGTLVFLMGLHNLEKITKKLIENGKSKDTLCSVVSCAFCEDERRIDGTLETITQKAKDAKTPAVIIVGEVCGFNFSKKRDLPLSGVSVTVTGTKHFVSKMCSKLELSGAYTFPCAYLKTIENSAAKAEDFKKYDWLVFTSANGVKIFFDSVKKSVVDFRAFAQKKFACIGSGSAGKLLDYGFCADYVPQEYTAQSLGKGLALVVQSDEKILLLRAENGSRLLTEELEKAKKQFCDLNIYKVLADESKVKSIDCKSDYIVFASGSSVKAFFDYSGNLGRARPVCIGEYTAQILSQYTDRDFLVSKRHTADDITETIREDLKK